MRLFRPKQKAPGSRVKCLIIDAVGTLAALYVVVCAFMYFIQDRLIYVPKRHVAWTPADAGLSFDQVEVSSANGERVMGWYIRHKDPRGALILCHGNGGNIANRIELAAAFHDLGLDVLSFDYQGYGNSSGSPNEQGMYDDAEAIWQHLVEHRGWSPEKIIIYGESMGGAVAIELATHHEAAALIVESTFTTLYDVARTQYPWLPLKLLMRPRYESAERVARIGGPKLFIHSTEDRLVPYELGMQLFDLAREPKEFLQTAGGHNGGGFLRLAHDKAKVTRFIASALDENPVVAAGDSG